MEIYFCSHTQIIQRCVALRSLVLFFCISIIALRSLILFYIACALSLRDSFVYLRPFWRVGSSALRFVRLSEAFCPVTLVLKWKHLS